MSRIALLAVLVLTGVDVVRGDTSLRIRGDVPGHEFDIPASDALITTSYDGADGSLWVLVECRPGDVRCPFQKWYFTFGSRLGQPLVDGVYENTQAGSRSEDRPSLSVNESPASLGCSIGTGRFEIRGLVPGPLGRLDRAAIDFEVECGGGVLVGAIHVASGDDACAGAADATPCDDDDPCTASDTCASERCSGERNPACDAFTCDDGDLCTTDHRVQLICVNLPVAGTCWVMGEATLAAVGHGSVGDRSASCRIRCRPPTGGVFVLLSDDTYRTEEGRITTGCPHGVVTVPAETGRVSADRRGRLVLTPDNLADLEAALFECAGDAFVLKHYRTRLRFADEGESLTGVTKLRMRVRDRVPVDVRETVRFHAVRRSLWSATAARAGARARALPACSADLRPKCVQD